MIGYWSFTFQNPQI